MARPTNPPHCVKKRRGWYARLNIPAAVRHAFGGRKTFITPLHEADRDRAYVKSIPIVAEWRQRIAAARVHQPDPLQGEIDRLAAEFHETHPTEQASAVLIGKVVNFVFQRIGGLAALEQHKLLTQARGDVMAALQTMPDPGRMHHAAEAVRQITRWEVATPFLTHLDKWIASLRTSKTGQQIANSVREFDEIVDQPIERLAGRHVQKWIDDLLTSGKLPTTVRFKRQSNKNYWQWMQEHELAPVDRNPFAGRSVKSQQSAAERAEQARKRFDPVDVPALWQEAERNGDYDLAAAIKLSVYMGWRIEEVAMLRVENIRTDRATGIRFIRGGIKSEAGIRDLPILSVIDDLVRKLAQRKDADGYLIRSTKNKWGQRGNAIGQRFSKMKTRMGYDTVRTFHSLRHCFAHMLSKAHVPMHQIKDLMGQRNKDVTEGYIGESGLDERLHWLALAIRFEGVDAS